jgi:hypothetical protein
MSAAAPLTFDEASHTYRVGGEVWPGVTSVLEPLQFLDGIPWAVLEAARKFAERVMLAATGDQERLEMAFQLALCRSPHPQEIKVLQQVLAAAHKRFDTDKSDAEKLVAIGYSKPVANLDTKQLAAWTTVTSLIMNLDEAISKP